MLLYVSVVGKAIVYSIGRGLCGPWWEREGCPELEGMTHELVSQDSADLQVHLPELQHYHMLILYTHGGSHT